MSVASRPRASAEDLVAREGEKPYFEVVDGEMVQKAAPSWEHGNVQIHLGVLIGGPFGRRGGGPPNTPGGWWLATECHVELETHQVFCPDVVGWRRDRVPEHPHGMPVRIRPDWICEVLSPSNAKTDLVKKFHVLQRCAVPHYWVVDPEREVLTVHRWTEKGYLVALQATRGETVRAEPFDAIELRVGQLFGDDPVD
jgi:Uma2 family endonuclease